MRHFGILAFAAMLGASGVYGFTQPNGIRPVMLNAGGIGCVIKGNISVGSGERIYHLPGQTYYDDTIITPAKGERWFCSEAEAIAAGWRRSKV